MGITQEELDREADDDWKCEQRDHMQKTESLLERLTDELVEINQTLDTIANRLA